MRLRYTKFVFFILSLLWTSIQANQVVLITGASRGIGYETAKLLASEGYIVYGGVRDISSFDSVSIVQQSSLKNFYVVELDVTDQKSIDLAVEKIFANEGRLDVLVNNAGIMIYGSVENVTIEEAKKLFDVNFFGVMRVTQAVLPAMRAQNAGRIIQISSRSGFRPLPSISIYAASKYALEGLSETMAAVVKPWNIYISLIEPGPVSTDLDWISPYGTQLSNKVDPYYPLFYSAGLLDPNSPVAQNPKEIALIIKQVIEEDNPLFRYQTTENIKRQAAQRLIDITGNSSIDEWHKILFSQTEK